jgi:hypothetical protein
MDVESCHDMSHDIVGIECWLANDDDIVLSIARTILHVRLYIIDINTLPAFLANKIMEIKNTTGYICSCSIILQK